MENENILFKFSSEQRKFIVFLLINILVLSLIGTIRLVLPTDSLEGIFWGSLHDFGTPKHPPLAAWITYLVYSVFKTDFSIYLLCTIFISTGFFYIYKIAKFFLDEKKAILSVLLMEGCWAYTYITSYYGFNPDVVLLCFLPMITYYSYKAVNTNDVSDWLKLGIITGLSLLNKYQTILVILPVLIWAAFYKRSIFKNKYFYISVLIAFVLFLPHLLWLIRYDFFPLLYFDGELSSANNIRQFWEPIIFLSMQLTALAGTLVFFVILLIKQKTPLKIQFSSDEKSWFLILTGFLPLIIHLVAGIITGGSMRPRWGYEFLYLTGIMLFYFIPTKEISKGDFNLMLKLAYFAMLVAAIAMSTLLGTEKNYRSRYPVSTIYNDINTEWNKQIDSPLKYLGGYIEWTLPLSIYTPAKPKCILDTNGYKNPWIEEDDLKKSGVIIIDRTQEEIIADFNKIFPEEKNNDIKPTEYRFKVKNAFNQEREYCIYYLIVPPVK